MRLRERDGSDGEIFKTAQIVYKRTSEIAQKKPEQFRYFPQLKEKMYFWLEQEMPKNIEDVEDLKVQNFLKKYSKQSVCDVNFERTVVSNPNTLFVSADKVGHNGQRPFYVAELKVYNDLSLLKKAMYHVMKEFPLVQTTHGKLELSCLCGNEYI